MISRVSPNLILASRYICASCARRLRPTGSKPQRRNITQTSGDNTTETKKEWEKRAREIREGKQESMLTMLENRGYVNQIVGYVVSASEGHLGSNGDAEIAMTWID